MTRKLTRVMAGAVLLFSLTLGSVLAFGQINQFPWASYVDLPYNANGQPGLAAINGNLILTWGDYSSNYLHASVSTNGVNWSTPVTLSGLPQVWNSADIGAPPPRASGGVNMTASTCSGGGWAYVAYVDSTGDNIYAARSQNGVNWDGDHLLVSLTPYWPGVPATASPALYGGYTNGTVGFAFPQFDGLASEPYGGTLQDGGWETTVGYNINVGEFPCDFSSKPQLTSSCFLGVSASGTCEDLQATPGYGTYNGNAVLEFDEGPISYNQYPAIGPWSPLWTGFPGAELRAVAQGNPLANAEPPIYYTMNEGAVQCWPAITPCPPTYYNGDGAAWANNGLGGAVQPVTGAAFLFHSCRPFYGGEPWDNSACDDTEYGSMPYIRVFYAANNRENDSYNWSPFAPAITFFNGALWVAACGGAQCNGGITVMSVYPAQLTGCTYSISNPAMYIPGSGGPFANSVTTAGSNCVWTAASNSSWITVSGGANSSGSGQFTIAATENPGTPQTGTLVVAANQAVTVNQGTVGGTPGTGSVTISGSPVYAYVNECPGEPYNCNAWVWESGTVSITVNGTTFTTSYGGPSWTAAGLASSLASQIEAQPSYSAVSATASGSTVTIISTINGANTNYSLSTSNTYATGFSGSAAYGVASGSSLTGGTN
jgi:hypothetical protein